MSQSNTGKKRNQYLVTSLIVLVVLILAVIFLILAYTTYNDTGQNSQISITNSPMLTSTQTIIITTTPTPTASRTLRPTPTSTITPTPTQTLIPTPTPTLSGPPTLTPAKPVIGDPYKLTEWTTEKADYMIELVEDYPNTLPERSRGENYENYYDSFFYATISQKEALLRFPVAAQASDWSWGLAYNLAQIGDDHAADTYGNIITKGLNQGEVDLDNLTRWFNSNEPRMKLYIIELEPIPNYLNSYLLNIRGRGDAFILLLETSSAFQYFILADLFDFVNDPEIRTFISDVTGDGKEEIGIYYIEPVPQRIAQRPIIYELSKNPPQEISFRPSVLPFNVGTEFKNNWGIFEDETGANLIYFETNIFPACPTKIRETYTWNDLYFELISTEYEFEPNPNTLSYCEFVIDNAINNWGYQPAVQLMEILLPNWPPVGDQSGRPYPLDSRDEWLFDLGIFNAQLGNYEAASGYLNELITNPSDPNGDWSSQANTFKSKYRKPEDLYQACASVKDCNANDALDLMINDYAQESDLDTIEYLWNVGAKLRASGYFDFDQDDKAERWFTLRHRSVEQLEYWILASSKQGVRGLYVSPVESSSPNLVYLDEDTQPPIVLVDQKLAIKLDRDPDTRTPFLKFPVLTQEYSDPFIQAMNDARDALFSGEDPEQVVKTLLALQDYPGLRCETNWTCDPYYYYLGLAYELADNDRMAIENYLFLWWNYSKSPFTTMARLKLEGTITPTPPSPTAIVTPTLATPSPSLQFSPTPTLTPAYPYPSPTIPTFPFQTPTIPYPYP